MIHGRPDYNRIQDPAAEPEIYRFIGAIADVVQQFGLGERLLEVFGQFNISAADLRAFAARAELPPGSTPIAADEPVFLVRARDVCAPAAVGAWATYAVSRGADLVLADMASAIRASMRDWQNRHGAKLPDLPTVEMDKGVAP